MVFLIGSGKMPASARPIEAVSFSEIITVTPSVLPLSLLFDSAEEVGTQQLTAKYVPRELCDADEANLIDEEDMHVYDLMPLSDPLHLVCCNACRKPIKISQYAAHAEICKSLGITEEMVSELKGDTRYKKRSKKEKKSLPTACASIRREEQERICSSKPNKKRQLSCNERAPSKGGPGGISDHLTDAKPPPTKRTKLTPARAVDKSDHRRIATGVTTSSCQSTQGKNICMGHLKGSTDQLRCFGLQFPRKALLGTKMFYSLRNHRLRSAIKCMYYESFSEGKSDDVHPNVSEGDEIELQVSVPIKSHEEFNFPMEKGEKQPSAFVTSLRKPGQVLANCSEVYMGKLGHIPSVDLTNQDHVNSSLNSQATSMGNMRSNYLPQSCPFTENSGSSLGTIQQPKGSVSVT